MDLYDLEKDDVFRWQGSLYRFLGEIDDNGVAKVVCIARKTSRDTFGFCEPWPENFNAYNDEIQIDFCQNVIEVSDDPCDVTCKNGIGIEITMSAEGDRIWLNSSEGVCLVRICNIQLPIEIKDARPKNKR